MKKEPEYPLSNQLIATQLKLDKRIVEAKRLFKEAIEAHKLKIKETRPPLAVLKHSYEEMLKDMEQFRGGKLWFPYLGSGLGNGPFVELADGSIKYDFISGIGPNFFGHNDLDLAEASFDAALSNTIMQGNLQQNTDSLELCHRLVELSGIPHCFLTTSGAMAVENALKIAFQKKFPAQRILAFDHCFAGRSLASSQITDKPGFREGLPLNAFIDYIPFFDHNNSKNSTKQTIDILEKTIARYPKQHAAMILEFVQGEGGCYAGNIDFFHEIIFVLKKNNIAVFADEVQTFGRTEKLFAYQHFDLQELVDIVSIGKISQTCATLFTESYKPKPGLLSQTFTGSTSSIKASLATLDKLVTGDYFGPEGKNKIFHDYFINKLNELNIEFPNLIKGPFGVGSMMAFTIFDGEAEAVTSFIKQLFHAGVICFIAGTNPSRVRFLIPAGVISFQDIDNVISLIQQTIKQKNG